MMLKNRYSTIFIMVLAFGCTIYFLLKQAPVVNKVVHEEVVRDVSFLEVSIGVHPIPIFANGKVTASDIRNISSEVTGLVTHIGDHVVRGGVVNKGDTLIVLDQKPLSLDVSIKQSDLDQAVLALMETKAKAKVAKRGAKKNASEFALFIPQLKSANSRVTAAKVALEYAESKLASSTILAPITGKIISLETNVGEYVTAAQPLITIYGVEVGEVRLALNDRQVKLLKLNEVELGDAADTANFPVVYLTNPQNLGVLWKGRITRVEGVRDSSQMMFVIAEVPLISMANTQSKHEVLIPGTYVDVQILGAAIEGVAILPRHAIRTGNTVWRIDQVNRLESQAVKLIYKDKQYAYVASGLSSKDKIVVSQFNNLVDGSFVKPINPRAQTQLVGEGL